MSKRRALTLAELDELERRLRPPFASELHPYELDALFAAARAGVAALADAAQPTAAD